MNVPKHILFRMNMDSEEELVEHVTVDGNDETDSLCEMEESLELTGTRSTASLPSTATPTYERDVDIEELLRDTPEPTNHEVTTQDSVEDITNKLNSKELQLILLIEERETLEKISGIKSEIERKKEMLSKVNGQIRIMLESVLENLETTKSHYDDVEAIKWIKTEDTAQIGRCEKELVEQAYQSWKELCKTLNDKWKWDKYKEILDECSKAFEEEDLEIIKECKRLETYLETKLEKILKNGEEYFRAAGLNI